MRQPNVVSETEPGNPRFSADVAFAHLKHSIEQFNTPGGLLAYWNQPKNQKRRAAMSQKQRVELEQYFQEHLAVLNNVGG